MRRVIATIAVLALSACASILGFDDVEPTTASSGGTASDGGGGALGPGGAGGSGGTGGSGTVGGMGGFAGAGGTTLSALGDPCAMPSQCQSGLCVDDVCCNETCGDVCEQCDAAGSEGTCTPRFDSTDAEDDCGSTVCDEGACTINPIDVWSSDGNASNDTSVDDAAVDSEGNLWLHGDFTGTMSFSPCSSLASMGGRDLFLVKLDPGGGCLFAARFGDSAQQNAGGIALDASDNVYLAGFFEGTVSFGGAMLSAQGQTRLYVAKLDSSGAHLASFASTGTGIHEAVDIAVSPSILGEIYVGGHFTGDLTVSSTATATSADVFALKLAQNLGQTWLTSWPTAGAQSLTALTADHAGRAVLAIDPGQGNDAEFGCTDVFDGTAPTQHAVLRLDTSGGCEFGVDEDGNNLSIVGLAVDDADQVYLTGAFDGFSSLLLESSGGGFDSYVMVLVSNNPPQIQSPWHRVIGGAGDQGGRAIVADGARIIVAGVDDPAPAGNGNLMLVGLDGNASGNPLFTRSYGDAGALQEPHALAVNPWRSIAVAGAFGGAMTGLQAENALSTSAISDGFVLAISPPP